MRRRLQILADENIPQVAALFSPLGEVRCVPGRSLRRRDIGAADVLLVRSVTAVNADLLDGTAVKFVGSATIGIDHLDCAYLQQRGIAWANAPGSNARSVVEYVLSAFSRLPGLWEQLFDGAQVGIVGAGNVGGQLYRLLTSLGINCVAYDPLIEPARYPQLVDFDTVISSAVLCLHTPLTQNTAYPSYHMFDHPTLSRLRKGAVLINAGRGAVVDNQALLQLLEQRADLQVVLDVWESEPDIDQALLKRVALATPHIAGYSYDGKLAGARMLFEACREHCALAAPLPPSVDDRQALALPLGQDWLDCLRRLILSVYDIAADDLALRQSLSAQPTDRGAAFDYLRKNYPVRREFSHYRIASPLTDERLHRTVAGLGFGVE